MSSKLSVLLYGANGGLGRVLVNRLPSVSSSMWAVSTKPVDTKNNIVVSGNWAEDLKLVTSKFEENKIKFDAIINVSGGWSGSMLSASTDRFINDFETMINKNFYTAVIAARLSVKFLNPSGFVIFAGADVARSGSPTMVGYGAAKAATHQLAQTLAMEIRNSRVITILPTIMDNEANRSRMPKMDKSSWSNPEDVASKILGWLSDPSSRPKSGEMLTIKTHQKNTTFEPSKTLY